MPEELKQAIMEFIQRMEKDLAREEMIQAQAKYEILENENCRFKFFLN